jgi:IclR family acetate operon transcriptional repressor
VTITSPDPKVHGIQSVERAVRILRSFAEPDQQSTITDLAQLLGVHKSTVSRLVATLVGEGLLEGGGELGRLRLGPEMRRLGRLAAGGANLAEIADAPMRALTVLTGESVTLSVRDGDHALTIAESPGTHRVGVQSWLGARTPLPQTADGKVFLALADEEPSGTSRALRAELARVRDVEWAAARGELEDNLYGVAVPIWDESGRCLAALCVSGPSYRVTEQHFERLAEQCRHAAYQISDRRHGYLREDA